MLQSWQNRTRTHSLKKWQQINIVFYINFHTIRQQFNVYPNSDTKRINSCLRAKYPCKAIQWSFCEELWGGGGVENRYFEAARLLSASIKTVWQLVRRLKLACQHSSAAWCQMSRTVQALLTSLIAVQHLLRIYLTYEYVKITHIPTF